MKTVCGTVDPSSSCFYWPWSEPSASSDNSDRNLATGRDQNNPPLRLVSQDIL